MTLSVTHRYYLNNQATQLISIKQSESDGSPAPAQEQNGAAKNLTEAKQSSDRVSTISPEYIDETYQKIRQQSREKLDEDNFQNRRISQFEYLNRTIDDVMDYPIEVKIDKSEVNTAILFNRIGVNFLDLKRTEVRMELLAEAGKELEQTKDQMSQEKHDRLNKKIEGHQVRLEEQKQAILAGGEQKDKEKLLLERLILNRSQFNPG